MSATRWAVQIIRPQDGKARTFSTHDFRDVAEIEAGKLRRHGFFVQVRCLDDDSEQPEHHGQRRAFVIWACMLGVIPPERVVERVLQDVAAAEASI